MAEGVITSGITRCKFEKLLAAAGLAVFGMSIFLGACSGVQPTQDKTPLVESSREAKLKQIKNFMWGEDDAGNIINMSEAESVDELKKILKQAISQNDIDVARATAEGLVPHTGKGIAEAIIGAYNGFPEEQGFTFGRYMIQLLGFNFVHNEAARPDISGFLRSIMLGAAKDNPRLAKREAMAVHYNLMGLMGYRGVRNYQRHTRWWNFNGWELRDEYNAGFMLWPLIAKCSHLFPSDPDKAITPEQGAYCTFCDPDRLLHENEPIRPLNMTLGSSEMIEWLTRVLSSRCTVNIYTATKCSSEGKTPAQIGAEKKKYAIYTYTNDAIPTRRGILQSWLKVYEGWREKKNYPLEPPDLSALHAIDEVCYIKYGNISIDPKLVIDVAKAIIALPQEMPEVKQEALRILGSHPVIDKETMGLLMQYLKSNDPDMVRIAAMGLQNKKGLPAEEILEILAQKKKENARFGNHLEELLLSSLDSPNAFLSLAGKIAETDPKNIAEIRKLAQELKLWYLGRGEAKRDQLVRTATAGLTKPAQIEIILWLRNISMMNPWISLPIPRFLPWSETQDGRMNTSEERENAIINHALEFRRIWMDVTKKYVASVGSQIVVSVSSDSTFIVDSTLPQSI